MSIRFLRGMDGLVGLYISAMVEWLFDRTFTLLFVVLCGYFTLHRILYAHLKKHHPLTWEKLGHRSYLRRNEAVSHFLHKRACEELGDPYLSSLSRITRIYRAIFFALLGTLFILAFL